ncbi:MAG TPA: hypothetical protein VFB29_17255 [Pseudolabrys sp.]|nr:hypothetical protein [Pseudolabrys sp.]
MLLGDILSRLDDDGEAAEIILGAGDLRLLARMREQAATEGLGLAAYTKSVVQRYVAGASDEEWLTAMGQIGRTADPGGAWLKRAFESASPR